MISHDDIRIGTLVKGSSRTADYLRSILPHGFETVQIVLPRELDVDLPRLAGEVRHVLEPSGASVSALGIYGNPLEDEQAVQSLGEVLRAAESFGCNVVATFAGRLKNRPVPESMGAFKRIFTPLAQQAEELGVRIALENCEMRGTWDSGDWNIAHAPAAWEMIFNEVPSDALGLEWEPCHQLNSLIDPLPQLREWTHKVYHVHGKDATVMWDIIRRWGIRGGKQYMHHRTPGFGDTNWADVISILRMAGYRGSIDIEGWHDPVYRDDLEMTGQVRALSYLKDCRGGSFVRNP